MRTHGWWAAAMVAGLGLAEAGALTAQGRMGPGPRGPDQTAAAALRLADELELTEEQRSALEALRGESLEALEAWEQETLEARQEMRARMRTAPRDDAEQREALRAEMRERMETLRDRRAALTDPLRTRLEEILTAEQRETLRSELRTRRPGARNGGRRGPPRAGRGARGARDGRVAPLDVRRGPALWDDARRGPAADRRGWAPRSGFRRPAGDRGRWDGVGVAEPDPREGSDRAR
ncbi:MAG TPA: Spy/CpxP family protein refolding chaperone [Longimicrobiales bacterium]|nr:Spy/CpxP family protein refolding chaperone [Longimicrobiales bacterium]